MKCPHCAQRISLFSAEMNAFGKEQACSRCGGGFTRQLDFLFIAIWALPALAMSMLMKPMLGVFSSLPAVALLLVYGYRLKAVPAVVKPPADAPPETEQEIKEV
jgi:hypothetical protein